MIEKLSEALRRGETTARALTEECLSRIKQRQGAVNAYITVTAEAALVAADRADARLRAGEQGPLLGIPLALKDNFTVAGVPATAASLMLNDFIPSYSATVWERLCALGGVLLGKLNMDEFAMGSCNEDSAFGAVCNPVDLGRVAGGSSGGTAAAVADGQAIYALGSDTGGSVRIPAAFCGVVGLKPTYGLVSRRGLIAFASSLDTVGICTRSVKDAAFVLSAIAGVDPGDMTTRPSPEEPSGWMAAVQRDVRGLRVGVISELSAVSPGVLDAYCRSVEILRRAGATIVSVNWPSYRDARLAYIFLTSAEASSHLARYDGIRYGHKGTGDTFAAAVRNARSLFGEQVERRLAIGAAALTETGRAAYYEKAVRLRYSVREELLAQFSFCDVILTPSAPDIAYRPGETANDPPDAIRPDDFAYAPSLAGAPAMTVPAGLSAGLPVGVSLVARPFAEGVLFAAAGALERGMDA